MLVLLLLLLMLPASVAFAQDNTMGLPPRPSMELRPSFSPNGTRIVFSSNRSGNWSIYTLEMETGSVTQISHLSENQFSGRFSPDGKFIAFYSNYWGNPWTGAVDHDLVIAGWDGSDLHQVFDDAANQIFPDWSPDGRDLIFLSDHEGVERLYRRSVESEDSDWVSLTPEWTTPGMFNARVHWRANAVFFDAPAPGALQDGPELWRLDLATGTLHQLTRNDVVEYGPNLSPDGSTIVYQTTDKSGRSQVAVMSADGSGQRTLTDQSSNMTPAWSPDGQQIVFVRMIEEQIDFTTKRRNRDIYIMDSDGTNVRRLLMW